MELYASRRDFVTDIQVLGTEPWTEVTEKGKRGVSVFRSGIEWMLEKSVNLVILKKISLIQLIKGFLGKRELVMYLSVEFLSSKY